MSGCATALGIRRLSLYRTESLESHELLIKSTFVTYASHKYKMKFILNQFWLLTVLIALLILHAQVESHRALGESPLYTLCLRRAMI